MCYGSYGRKRDKQIVFSPGMTSWTVFFFFAFFRILLVIPPLLQVVQLRALKNKQRTMDIEQRTTNDGHRATNNERWTLSHEQQTMDIKQQIIWLCKFRLNHLEYFSKCVEITLCRTHLFLIDVRDSKKGRKEVNYDSKSGRPSTSRTEVIIERVRYVRVWRSSFDCSNDCKSVGYEKELHFEDYHQRFGQMEKSAQKQ